MLRQYDNDNRNSSGHRRPETSAFEQFAAAAAAANQRDMQELAAARDMHDIRIQDIGTQPRILTPPEPLVPGTAQGGESCFYRGRYDNFLAICQT